MNEQQRTAFFEWLPIELCGKTVTKLDEAEIVSQPPVPALIVYYPTVSRFGEFYDGLLRLVYNDDESVYNEYWGHEIYGVVSIAIIAATARDASTMAHDLIKKLFQNKYGITMEDDQVAYLGVETSELIPPWRTGPGKATWRTVIDIRVIYELSYERTEPPILSFSEEYQESEDEEISITLHSDAPGYCRRGFSIKLV